MISPGMGPQLRHLGFDPDASPKGSSRWRADCSHALARRPYRLRGGPPAGCNAALQVQCGLATGPWIGDGPRGLGGFLILRHQSSERVGGVWTGDDEVADEKALGARELWRRWEEGEDGGAIFSEVCSLLKLRSPRPRIVATDAKKVLARPGGLGTLDAHFYLCNGTILCAH